MMKNSFKTVALCLILFVVASAQTRNAGPGHWPQWRGPYFNGMARGDAPTEWSATKNIKWKAQIPGRGHSTPIIWGDRIFLTTAIPAKAIEQPTPQPVQEGQRRGPGGGAGSGVEHRFVVMCIDRKTGKTIWERTAKTDTPHEGYHRMYGSFASNSPITDGKYLYVSFGSYGIFCYDLNGKLIWQKDPGVRMKMRLQFGEGVAPTLHGDRLFLTYDHEGESFIIALDKNTGREVWRSARNEASSWSTPLVIDHKGQKLLVVSATNRVRAYDPASGRIVWECGGLGGNVIPAPVQIEDVVLVMSGFRNPKLMAVRLGRQGDLTETDAVLWSQTRGTSYTASPVLHEGKFYALTDNGMLSCFDAKTGQTYYHQVRLPKPDNFKASPVGANGKLYLASESGDVTIVKMGEKFEVMKVNTIEDEFFIATPIIVEGQLFLRGRNTLYCISEK